ncbi:MAG: Crp/Fnr family transcriptional regulator [Ilumatobacter sp.]
MLPNDILEIARSHPSLERADGETVIADGDASGALLVLSSGSLRVSLGGREVSQITEPGSVVGEIGLLLGTPASADVHAVGATVLHRIDDAERLFTEHPDFGRHLAEVLARRLRQISTFLVDIDRQLADRTDTLGLVPGVIAEIMGGSDTQIDAGSEREPDAPY